MRERGYVFRRSFPFRRKYWYKNALQIPTYFRIVYQLIKYGYDGYAVWDTFSWFIEMIKSILSTATRIKPNNPKMRRSGMR